MRNLSIALVLALTALLALGNAVECEEESGISTTRVKKLYGKNYVGKLESTATIPSGGIPFLTKDGLLLKGHYIFDGMTGRLLKDISIELLMGGKHFYYNDNTNNYYIITNSLLYIYSLSTSRVIEMYILSDYFGEYEDKMLLFADDNYIYYSSCDYGDEDIYCLINRYDYINERNDSCELSNKNIDIHVMYYQICYEPCFTLSKDDEHSWFVDWRTDKPIITRLDSKYYKAEYVLDGKAIAWEKNNEAESAVCISILDQSKVLWHVPEGFLDCERSNKYELLFCNEKQKRISIRIEDGRIMNELTTDHGVYGLSWLNNYAIICTGTLNVQNLRTSEILLPKCGRDDECFEINADKNLFCAVIYDSIVVYSLEDEKEIFRIKYQRMFDEYIKIYWSRMLRSFVLLRVTDDKWTVFEISRKGMIKKCEGNDYKIMVRELLRLCCVRKDRNIAMKIIDNIGECRVNIENDTIYVSEWAANTLYIIRKGIVTEHKMEFDDYYFKYINDMYAIAYTNRHEYLYSLRTRNKLQIENYEKVCGESILFRTRNINVYNVEKRENKQVLNLANLWLKVMHANNLIIVEYIYDKCYIILRTEPCEPDEQAKRITEFLENEERQ